MQCDIAIIGAGPVGLTLAILLTQQGHLVHVYEKRRGVAVHSRAIGLHPPALEVLHLAGISSELLARGVPIRGGSGFYGGEKLATLDFSVLRGAYQYVLSLPQNQTQELLRRQLFHLAPHALHEGTGFASLLTQGEDMVRFNVQDEHGELFRRQARWLVAADGVGSTVRDALGLSFAGHTFPDQYRMGDYPDTTELGPNAALFLHQEGIVESFPLPGSRRRWVAHFPQDSAASLSHVVTRRTGHFLETSQGTMLSDFATANRTVRKMVHGRIILIGDAAHQVSPIGGQGLALGLLDAAALAAVLNGRANPDRIELVRFERARLQAAHVAGRQARVNMILGRPFPKPLALARNQMIRVLGSNSLVRTAVARKFTMTAGRRKV
ncbi:NAD(P)/FAD-dependent oxidoreductase [Arthrobacter sp. MYb213]|uniref:FAD-dependent oxidoreductase n=1 Tax=Arthrobacter sp. MYb213 TaxID=1848595 RepID=UPI000CFC6F7F|nr:NAD(P)/FAD-dependent oxidoreductase [Arthrobacter sp. MYb213]PRB70479.1 FAD-binding monooxygenase [Arthrobacter sp. MYb213]